MDRFDGTKLGQALLVLFFSITMLPLSAQYRELSDFLAENPGLKLEWNPLTESGFLRRESLTISFKIDVPFLLVNYERKINTRALLKSKNRILLHTETGEEILGLFARQKEKLEWNGHVAVIIIDPGHGGKDPGAVGSHTVEGKQITVNEKDIVLQVALKLESFLKQHYTAKRIILTRREDVFVNLETRSQIANEVELAEHDSILFISLHTNSGFNRNAQGFEVWHLPSDYRRVVIDEARTGQADAEILPILNTMLEEEYLIESIKLASLILENLEKQVGGLSPNRGLKEEAWSVVRKSNMPSILIELGFLSHQEEVLRLRDEGYQNKLALGIYQGIIDFTTAFESVKGFGE